MDAQVQLDDLDSQLDVIEAASDAVCYALNAINGIPDSQHRRMLFPSLRDYIAIDPLDVEVQFFNLCRIVPERMKSNDALAAWMLETDTLNRYNVAMYLASESLCNGGLVSSSGVLDQISMSICSLDVGQRFIDGLKLFLPTTGALLLNDRADPSYRSVKHRLLGAYARAHLQVTQAPILPLGQDSWLPAADIAMCIVDLNESISSGRKALSGCMNDFIAAVKSAVSREVNISIKLLTELFNDTISGTPLAPLPPPDRAPQYLFPSCRASLAAQITLLFAGEDIIHKGWLVVAGSALYLFDEQVYTAGPINIDAFVSAAEKGIIPGELRTAPIRPGFILCLPLPHCSVEVITDRDDTAGDRDEQTHLLITSIFPVMPVLQFQSLRSRPQGMPSTGKCWRTNHFQAVRITLLSITALEPLNYIRDEIEAAIWNQR
jgi:hypothetical protein